MLISKEEKEKSYLFSHYLHYNNDIYDPGLSLSINIHVTDTYKPDFVAENYKTTKTISIELFYSPPGGTIGKIKVKDKIDDSKSKEYTYRGIRDDIIQNYMKEYAYLYISEKDNLSTLFNNSIELLEKLEKGMIPTEEYNAKFKRYVV